MAEDKKNEEIIKEEDTGEFDDEALIAKLKKLKEQLKHCQQEKQEYLTGWQRSQADFINYRRRQEEQLGEWLKISGEKVIGDILPALDTLEPQNYAKFTPLDSFASNGASAEQRGNNELVNGLKNAREQLLSILKKHGLEEIKSLGEKFNPEYHEAVERVESGKEEGIIVEEVQKGYLLNGKVIRTAKVKVNK